MRTRPCCLLELFSDECGGVILLGLRISSRLVASGRECCAFFVVSCAVAIPASRGREKECRVAHDVGSDASFEANTLAEELGTEMDETTYWSRVCRGRGSAKLDAGSLWMVLVLIVLLGQQLSAQPLPESLQLADLDGSQGGVIPGVDRSDLAGYWVGVVGDVNGDGLSDFAVSAPQAGGGFEGEIYLFFGSRERRDRWRVQDLDGTRGAILRGAAAGESSGVSVGSVGDFDGDGFGDFIIGAPFASPGGRTSAGGAYLVFGGRAFPPFVDLGDLGTRGMAIEGGAAFDQAGLAVAGAGDVNGDGLSDALVSAHRADGPEPNRGAAYVIYGSSPPPQTLDLGQLNGSGVELVGAEEEDEAGFSLSGAGDVNGDGFDDLVVGAFRADPDDRQKAGEVYVVYGGSGLPKSVDLGALNGVDGFTARGVAEKDEAGFAVAGGGDINGDGFDDIALSAPAASPDFRFVAGETYVIYGGANLPAELELASLDGVNGIRLEGVDPRDSAGECLATVGDIDNDGFDDLLLGAAFADPGEQEEAGEAYLVLGGSNLPAELELDTLVGVNGMRLDGIDSGDFAGFGCGGGGDVDGDGIEDVLVGAPSAFADGDRTGAAYLVYGQSQVTLELSGACPGEVAMTVGGLAPGGSAALLRGRAPGVSVLGAGACAGEQVDLSGPTFVAFVEADESGEGVLTATVPAGGCDRWLQVVDGSSCGKSAIWSLSSSGRLWKTAEP